MSVLLGVAVWITPALLFAAVAWRARSRGVLQTSTVLMFPVCWLLGLWLQMTRAQFQLSEFLASHRSGPMTEEEFFSIPDGPNIFAGWIILGWVPVLIGFYVTRPYRRRVSERLQQINH